jgi:hypothetical protein
MDHEIDATFYICQKNRSCAFGVGLCDATKYLEQRNIS